SATATADSGRFMVGGGTAVGRRIGSAGTATGREGSPKRVGRTTATSDSAFSAGQYGQRSQLSSMKCPFSHRLSATFQASRMEGHRNRVAPAEVDDVADFEEPLVGLLVVDVRPVRRIPVDQQHFAIDRDHFRM